MKNRIITAIERIMQRFTSAFFNVKMDVEPNSVEQTSPEILADVEKMFIIRYPRASELTEIIASAASPFIFLLPIRIIIATKVVIGRTTRRLLFTFKIVPIAMAPNATCDRPSPMKLNLFNTRVTPSSEEHNAMSTPTIIAYLTNGY